MKIISPWPDPHDLEARAAWLQARIGRPTAGSFTKILTPKGLKPSAQMDKYAAELLAEKIIGQPLDDDFQTQWSHRGTEMESEAVAYYEFQRDAEVQRVGLCVTDDEKVGASPDGLVGSDGGLEIKCYAAPHHMRCLLGIEDPVETLQVHGGIYVCEREWWDQLAYLPGMPPVLLRTYRDEKIMKALEDALRIFLDKLAEYEHRLEIMGKEGRTDATLERLLAASLEA